jgi:uncharacterized protein (DUF2235 family)
MSKNVIIFSDGTGQAGGLRFDENRSNIYKLYRATRCGPDSAIDPHDQVAFYDPGLGSPEDGENIKWRALRWLHNKVAQATGFGITRNIIDCYAALIQLWQPGDRIYLFGFSRGAYTVRCLAGVIAFCGIPRHPRGQPDLPLKIDSDSAQKLAAYAVKHVYQFTYPRKLDDATPYQKFLLETRANVARRFRDECGSAGGPDAANVYPHFIGVFDTVASLGSAVTTTLFGVAFLLLAAALGAFGEFLSLFGEAPAIGWVLSYLTFWHVFIGTVTAAVVVAIGVYLFTHFKWDFRVPGYDLGSSLNTMHFNDLWMTFYDYDLNPNVGYARHAISIDEDRANFKRVPWHSIKTTARDVIGIQWFEQVWFSGVHADVGGGYPENESRLSDIPLDWMLRWASLIPGGLKHDPSVLKRWPYPEGPQHDEVKAGLGLITTLTDLSWSKQNRLLRGADAVMHRSVYQRFDLAAAPIYDELAPYRPETLRTHTDFSLYYQPGAAFPARSLQNATVVADDPAVIAEPLRQQASGPKPGCN